MASSIEVSNVRKQFGAGNAPLVVLEEIDLSITPGEFVAIVGRSGCGKSTLLRLLGGLDQPSSGHVRIDGSPVSVSDARCAMVFQQPRLFPWKRVDANVAVGARRLQSRRPVAPWLEQVGLAGFERAFPHQLSGGMAQRVALARALIGDPQVLLLDEPFAALDALTRLQMQELLAASCHSLGATVVMVTHDIDEALALADRVVVMTDRPGSIREIITLSPGAPVTRDNVDHARLRARVLSHFGFDSCTESAGDRFDSAAD